MMLEQWLVPSIATLIAAFIGFVAGLARDRVQRRDQRQESERDLTRQLVAESIAGAQWCGSIVSHLSTLNIDRHGLDTPEHTRTRTDLGEAVSKWNTAMYQLYVLVDLELVVHLRAIDKEISTLYEKALSSDALDKADHQERRLLGTLLAKYVDEARHQLSRPGSDLEPLELETLWSWAGSGTATGSPGTVPTHQLG